MRSVTGFNRRWTFHEEFDDSVLARLRSGRLVDLPHNAVDLPLTHADETVYQKPFCYQKVIDWNAEFSRREVSLLFDGAMADTVVYLNGQRLASHRDGYTPFEVVLTGHLREGKNLVTVVIDGSENPDVPPFGGQIDYLTYAGIYRDVWLKACDPVSIEDVKIETPSPLGDVKSVVAKCRVRNPHAAGGRMLLKLVLADRRGRRIASTSTMTDGASETLEIAGIKEVRLWEPDNPSLYRLSVELECPAGCDTVSTWFGFREARFTPHGFLLNGRKLKIRGLNRHQSFPYVGYAMGRRAQERDAETLKHELKCNLVRTSHYPQSPWFLDHCDRIGLLVFEEIPGWQHIGGEDWKRESLCNVERMIRRDWNHPSIVLWGVRINESADDHDFYSDTNRLARQLDSTRQTAGVRNFAGSDLIEDVYTMNDFVCGSEEMPGINHHRIALRKPSEVTCLDYPVPYLVTEFNGHMHPTKRGDPEARQIEHVTRYLQVLDAANGNPGICGSVGWCMNDYNTHGDFGSSDRICHHGVLDMFREPKFAAWAYASQCDPSEGAVLQPVTYWARGERSIGGAIPMLVLTNCDEVEFSIGDGPVRRVLPDRGAFPSLTHPPVIIDHGHIPLEELDRWGMKWYELNLTGIVDGREVKRLRMVSNPLPTRLDVRADHEMLIASEKDAVRIVVRVLDQVDNVLAFFNDPLIVEVNGPGRLLGPSLLSFRSGIAAFWVESVGEEGQVGIDVQTDRLDRGRLLLEAAG